MSKFIQTLLLVLLFPLVFSHCSSTSVDPNNPESLYKDALDDMENNRFLLAHQKLGKVKNQFPYSKFAVLSRLKTADVYFLEEAYLDAASSYETFQELHPNHELVSYASFRVGESYFRATPENIARDLSTAKKAIHGFQSYLSRFPSGELAGDAKNRILESQSVLAQKELYIGNFYRREDKISSAKKRYEDLILIYPNTEAAKEANEILKEIEDRI